MGAKQLSWRSVTIPRIMPKPDLIALTGGYRRTPVLQIGANIICDTALIARKLNNLTTDNDLYPASSGLSAQALASWADSYLFQCAVPLGFRPEVMTQVFDGDEAAMKAFLTDRAAMRKGSPAPRMPFSEAENGLMLALKNFEEQLQNGQTYLFGEAPCIADFSVYHPLWFLITKPIAKDILNDFPNILKWMENIAKLGHGDPEQMSSEAAIEIARSSQIVTKSASSSLGTIQPGAKIVVQPTDYGIDPVEGEFLYCDEFEVVLKREDERAGTVAVHFPRVGYMVTTTE